MELSQIDRPSSALEKSFREATAEVEEGARDTPTSKDLDTSARAKIKWNQERDAKLMDLK